VTSGEAADHPTDNDGSDGPSVLLRIERGDPSPDELAALVAVVIARQATTATSHPEARRSPWSSPARSVRGIHRTGPDAWRWSARPS